MEGKAIVAGKVQELGVEGDLWGSFDDYTLEIVISMAVRHSVDFVDGAKMSVQEKLQGVAGIEVAKQIAGVGEKVYETIEDTGRNPPLHPVDLRLFAW